jgi:hypothetical protein
MNQIDQYAEEAKLKWGDTDAFKQSQERVKKMGEKGLDLVMQESKKLSEEIAECMKNGNAPESDIAQKLIDRHYNGLKAFYEPNIQIYSGLAEMYIADERFKLNYEKVAEGLAQFMHDAMKYYVLNTLKHANLVGR